MKRGRPKGFKMSEESKTQTAKSMTGRNKSEESKEKTRKSMLEFRAKERKNKKLGTEQSHHMNKLTTTWNKLTLTNKRLMLKMLKEELDG